MPDYATGDTDGIHPTLAALLNYAPRDGASPAEIVRLVTAVQVAAENDESWIASRVAFGSPTTRLAIIARLAEWLNSTLVPTYGNVVFALTLLTWYVARAPGGPRDVLASGIMSRLLHAVVSTAGVTDPADGLLACGRACTLVCELLRDNNVATAAAARAATIVQRITGLHSTARYRRTQPLVQYPLSVLLVGDDSAPWFDAIHAASLDELDDVCRSTARTARGVPTHDPVSRILPSTSPSDREDGHDARGCGSIGVSHMIDAAYADQFDVAGAVVLAFRVLAVYPDRPVDERPSATIESRALLSLLRNTVTPSRARVSGETAVPPSGLSSSVTLSRAGHIIVLLGGLQALEESCFTPAAVTAVSMEVRDAIQRPPDADIATAIGSLPRLCRVAALWPCDAQLQAQCLSAAFNSTCSDNARGMLKFDSAAVTAAGVAAAAALCRFGAVFKRSQPPTELHLRHVQQNRAPSGEGRDDTDVPSARNGNANWIASDRDAVAACTAAALLLYSPASTTYGVEAATAATLALQPPAVPGGLGCADALVPFIERLLCGPRTETSVESCADAGEEADLRRAAAAMPPSATNVPAPYEHVRGSALSSPSPRLLHVPAPSEWRALQQILELLKSWLRCPSVVSSPLSVGLREVLQKVAQRCGNGTRALPSDVVPEGVRVAISALISTYGRCPAHAHFASHAIAAMDGDDDSDDGAAYAGNDHLQ